MNNKSFRINKIIKLENEVFEIYVTTKPNTFASETIFVEIIRFNHTELFYTYETVKFFSVENRYTDVIQAAINEFKEDKSIQSLLNWDGKLKYKIIL